jgi:hypothetical protein
VFAIRGTVFADSTAAVGRVLPVKVAVYMLWLVAVGGGFVLILNYQNAGGRTGIAPQNWPAGTQVVLDHNHDTLIMFAHPKCPCTRASMEELNRLLARSNGKVAAQVWFFKPSGFPNDWTRTGLWASAAAIPGVAVHEDTDGAESRRFGAETSGYVLLYDTRGQLLFSGGITAGRGHAGDNAGENTVVSLLARQEVKLKHTEVYGCSLLGECKVLPAGVAK